MKIKVDVLRDLLENVDFPEAAVEGQTHEVTFDPFPGPKTHVPLFMSTKSIIVFTWHQNAWCIDVESVK